MARNEINIKTSMKPSIESIPALPIESKLALINAIMNGYITGKLRMAIKLKLCPERQAMADTNVRIDANPRAANAMIPKKFGTLETGDPNKSQNAAYDPNPVINSKIKLYTVFDNRIAPGEAIE